MSDDRRIGGRRRNDLLPKIWPIKRGRREGGERGGWLGCVGAVGEEGDVREGGHGGGGGGMFDLQGGPKLLRIQNRQAILFNCADMYHVKKDRLCDPAL